MEGKFYSYLQDMLYEEHEDDSEEMTKEAEKD